MVSAFDEVMEIRGATTPAEGEVAITGHDPVYSTKFRIGETCAAVLAGVGVAISDIWEMKTGRRQDVAIDVRHSPRHEAMRAITQPWPTKDGRSSLPHVGLPNLAERALKVLDCKREPGSVKAAVARRDAMDLEDAFDEIRGPR